MYYLIVILFVAIDQGIKYLISSNMKPGESFPLIENIVHITYITNTGGAFSILRGQTILLIVIPAALVIAFIAYIHIKRKSARFPFLFALSLICAGGIGNLIDRIRVGEVVDFIDFRFFPVFNFADMCVCCGCGLMLLYMVLYERRNN